MATSAFHRHPIAMTVGGTLIFAVVAAQAGLAAPVSDEWQHALSHAGPGIGATFLGVAIRRLWPAPAETGSQTSRTALTIGLVLFAVGQIVEAAGAFGYRGNTPVSSLATLHDVGVRLTPVALLVILGGLAAAMFGAVAARRGALKPNALKIAAVVAVAAAVAYVAAGIVFGF